MKYPAPLLSRLAEIYIRHDTTVDALAQDPNGLSRIAVEVAQATGAMITPHETLDALLYARKKKLLPRLRRKPR